MSSKNLNDLIYENIDIKVDMSEINEQLKSIYNSVKDLNLPKIELSPEAIQGILEWQRLSEEFSNTVIKQFAMNYLLLQPELEKIASKLLTTILTSVDTPTKVTRLSNSILTHIDNLQDTPPSDVKIAITKATEITIGQFRDATREENIESESRMKDYIDEKFKESNRSSAVSAFIYFLLGILVGSFVSLYPDKLKEAIADFGHFIEQTVLTLDENEVGSE